MGFLKRIFTHKKVTVKDYGAKADGTTDDTQSFLDAIAAAAVNGGKVIIEEADAAYRISQKITVPENVSICGVGRVTIKAIAVMDYMFGTEVNNYTLQHGRITNLILDGDNLADRGVYFYKKTARSTTPYLSNIRIRKTNIVGAEFIACQTGTVEDLIVDENNGQGILMKGCNATIFDRLKVWGNSGIGITVEDHFDVVNFSGGNTINNVYLEDNEGGQIVINDVQGQTQIHGGWIECAGTITGDAITINESGALISNIRILGFNTTYDAIKINNTTPFTYKVVTISNIDLSSNTGFDEIINYTTTNVRVVNIATPTGFIYP